MDSTAADTLYHGEDITHNLLKNMTKEKTIKNKNQVDIKQSVT